MKSLYIWISIIEASVAKKSLRQLAGQTCIAPTVPGFDGCSDCEAANLNGGQCVRGGRWTTCYQDAEHCCLDGEVANNIGVDECVNKYLHPASDDCDEWVSKDNTYTNDECRKVCKLGEKSDKCQVENFQIQDNRVITTGWCFNNWVHGYSEPANLSGYKVIEDVETPAMCQALCQQDDDCVRFLWAADSAGDSQYDRGHRCSLKNSKHVEVAAAIIYTSVDNPKNYDADYCNYGMAHECWTGHYVCAPCEDHERHCIWKSDKHVAGWKFCPDQDTCSIPDHDGPHHKPTEAPTPHRPDHKPTEAPTPDRPEHKPTEAPTPPHPKPTEAPTHKPAEKPTEKPAEGPTRNPGPHHHPGTKPSNPGPSVTNPSDPNECDTPGNSPICHGGCHHHHGCCDNDRDVVLRIHDKPKKIRLAIDN